MTIELETSPEQNLIEQFGRAQIQVARTFMQKLATEWAGICIDRFLAGRKEYRLVHHSSRQIFTPLGPVEIPNAEIREGQKYVGTVSQLVFGLKKKQQVLSCTKDMISSIVTVLSFRKSAEFLGTFWGSISHQHLHKAWRSLENDIPLVLQIMQRIKKAFNYQKVLAWLDGWIVKTRECRGAEVIRNTLRVAVVQFKIGNEVTWKATCGFLEYSYQQLYRRLVPASMDSKVILLCDGEASLEQGFSDDPRKKSQTIIDHDTGEVIDTLIVIAGIQRCLFHLGYNIISKSRSEGLSMKDAEELSNNLKRLTYFRCITMRSIGECWEEVIMKRISVLHWICDDLVTKHFPKTAGSIRRAIPHLFTYVSIYCREKIFIGRTTNQLERMFREATYRVKRIGAVWSPKGARQMMMFIFAKHFNYSLSLSTVKPLGFHIYPSVVKR